MIFCVKKLLSCWKFIPMFRSLGGGAIQWFVPNQPEHPISGHLSPIIWMLSICSNCFFQGNMGHFEAFPKAAAYNNLADSVCPAAPKKPAEVSAAKSRAAGFLRHFLPAWPRHSQRSRCHNRPEVSGEERYCDPQCKAGFKSLVDGFKCRFLCVSIYIIYYQDLAPQ